jgi:hypothetical protein
LDPTYSDEVPPVSQRAELCPVINDAAWHGSRVATAEREETGNEANRWGAKVLIGSGAIIFPTLAAVERDADSAMKSYLELRHLSGLSDKEGRFH